MIQTIAVALVGLLTFGVIAYRLYRFFVPKAGSSAGCGSSCDGCKLSRR